MNSKIKSAIEQGQLPLTRNALKSDIPVDVVAKQKTFLGAVNLCITESGLEDKEIYLALDIDAGHFSHLRKGEGHFPINKLNDLCDLCGNEAPLQWFAHSRDYGLVMLQSEAERRAEELEKQLADERLKNRVLIEALHGKISA